jgi:hypothetical protein
MLTPTGSILLVAGAAGRTAILEPGEASPYVLRDVRAVSGAFADPEGLVFVGHEGLSRLDLTDEDIRPYARLEGSVDLLVGSPTARRVFYANAGNLYLVRPPAGDVLHHPVRLHRWRLW